MLTADEAGITGLSQKSCTFSFLSFIFDPLTSFVHFVHFSFAACDTLDLVGKNWSVGKGENYFAEIAYCLPLNWQSAMSNGRTSLSREGNLSLQLDKLKDYIMSSHNTICGTSSDIHKSLENRRQFIFMVCLYISLHKCQCKTQRLSELYIRPCECSNKQ